MISWSEGAGEGEGSEGQPGEGGRLIQHHDRCGKPGGFGKRRKPAAALTPTMQQGVGTGGIRLAAALLPPPKPLSRSAPLPPLPAIPPKAMAFFLLIQANDMA